MGVAEWRWKRVYIESQRADSRIGVVVDARESGWRGQRGCLRLSFIFVSSNSFWRQNTLYYDRQSGHEVWISAVSVFGVWRAEKI